ncbi:MAG: NAD(P)-dependent oxidoreductase [Betaproteobacteria bacterium]|nr:NAD(P)-dependent oxidoreductase [Betaproteobacteria bacterium]
MSLRRIGFVGVGRMGDAMAARLLRRGFDVVAYDRDPLRLAGFVAQHGGSAARSLAEAAAGADALITMLPHGGVVREALLGPGGAAGVLAADSIVIDMSSTDPESTKATGAELAQRGIRMVDAPVMGGVVFARNASLDILAGGDPGDIDRCEELLSSLGRRIYRCGPLGSGHTLKAIANYINAATLSAVLEGMTVGRKAGLDTALMAEALTALCAGRQHPLEKKVIPQVLTRSYATGMTLDLIAKDLRIAVGLAAAHRAAAPIAACVASIWDDASEHFGADVDQAEIVRYWEERGNVRL